MMSHDPCCSSPPCIPTDEPCTEFFCTFYWYYVIGVGGAVLIAIATACVAFVCKMCCRRKVSYAQGQRTQRAGLGLDCMHDARTHAVHLVRTTHKQAN